MQNTLTIIAILISLLVTSGFIGFILRFAIRITVLERIEQVQDGNILHLQEDMMPRSEQEQINRGFDRRISNLEP